MRRRLFRLRFVALLVGATVALAACSSSAPSMVRPKGSEAHTIAGVWWLMFALAAGVYAIVGGLIVYALFRGRRSDRGRPSRLDDNRFIWIGGVVVPVLILLVLAVATVHAATTLRKPDASALHIEVVAHQYWWEVHYPDLDITTANQLHVPAGRPLRIGLASADVIHSFWVPQLGGKVDTIPGQHNQLSLTVDDPGDYRGQCAEYCGVQHANMAFDVVAQTPTDFQRWVTREQTLPPEPSSELVAEGERVFMSQPCAGCHTIKGTPADGTKGPDLTDFGTRDWIGARTIPNHRDLLSAWINDAQQFKPGSLMPPIKGLSSRDTQAIVAYLESLK